MFSFIDNFYEENQLGLMTLCFQNMIFESTYQSKHWPISERLHGYPCYESASLKKIENCHGPYDIFKNTFEKKTNLKILHFNSFFRKIKLEELKRSSIYKKERPHVDDSFFDYAGIIYFNSNSLRDGTSIYDHKDHYEPTAIIGSKLNRCVYYNASQPHSTPTDQLVEERWVQPFFLITSEENYNKYRKVNYET